MRALLPAIFGMPVAAQPRQRTGRREPAWPGAQRQLSRSNSRCAGLSRRSRELSPA